MNVKGVICWVDYGFLSVFCLGLFPLQLANGLGAPLGAQECFKPAADCYCY